ncbi:MAG: AMP-binding protein [Pseudomonadota bacterium]|nr:AMP-binding protein [Pseudomonadota bacterium]
MQQPTLSGIGALFRERARIDRSAVALLEGDRQISYGELNDRVNRLVHVFAGYGLGNGDRIAILARNCAAYMEVELAAAKLGVLVAALNWRLSADELSHCIALAEPKLVVIAEDYVDTLDAIDCFSGPRLTIGGDYESCLALADHLEPPADAGGEDGLVILYTSGTTGRPKGAVISHRALLARAAVFGMDLGIRANEAFVAWAPFFHMASTDQALATLLRGGAVIIIDGYDADAFHRTIASQRIGWLPLIPGMIEQLLRDLAGSPAKVKAIRVIGAMPDLVAAHHIVAATERLNAAYVNSFGSTETGLPPATGGLIPIGGDPTDLAKTQSSLCEIRLVDEHDNDVSPGTPGECAIRGPTLFSGYWRDQEATNKDFRGGWFHMGDVFVRHEDGRLAFKDRVKYLIKSGGENIYPAEIERVLLSDPAVDDAVVVRRLDTRWGEVPVAAVAVNDPQVTVKTLLQRCQNELARYKQPKEIRLVRFEDLPRSTTGKVQRHEVEPWFQNTGSDSDTSG